MGLRKADCHVCSGRRHAQGRQWWSTCFQCPTQEEELPEQQETFPTWQKSEGEWLFQGTSAEGLVQLPSGNGSMP